MFNQNGENNFAAIVTEEHAIMMRAFYTIKERQEIFALFPQYNPRTITAIISGQNWKSLPIYKKRKKEWVFPKDYTEEDKIN